MESPTRLGRLREVIVQVVRADFTHGNAPRLSDSIRERATENVDFSLAKNFQAEAFRVTFRADFLKRFNTPRYGGGDQWGSNIGNWSTAAGSAPFTARITCRGISIGPNRLDRQERGAIGATTPPAGTPAKR